MAIGKEKLSIKHDVLKNSKNEQQFYACFYDLEIPTDLSLIWSFKY